ncbi:hypothetical protein AB5I41_24555 [Sphingomonas sp. MMS24-JH45]
MTATSTTAASARCRADVGVRRPDVATNGAFTLAQADVQGVSGLDLSQPEPER